MTVPLPPFPDERVPALRTHEWLGLEDDDRCGACLVVLADCTAPCPGE